MVKNFLDMYICICWHHGFICFLKRELPQHFNIQPFQKIFFLIFYIHVMRNQKLQYFRFASLLSNWKLFSFTYKSNGLININEVISQSLPKISYILKLNCTLIFYFFNNVICYIRYAFVNVNLSLLKLSKNLYVLIWHWTVLFKSFQ